MPRRLARWLPVLQAPHTLASAAARMGTTQWAVKQAKRKLRRLGFDVPAALRKNAAGRTQTTPEEDD